MAPPKNKNTVFPLLSYESVLIHTHNLEESIETNRLPAISRRQTPITICTIIEQFCRTKKKFAYGNGEPMPKELKLNVSLVMDMLDWVDGWSTDNTHLHMKTFQEYVKDITNDGSFKMDIKRLDAMIDDACSVRPPLVVESLAASALNFQSVEAINSLDITDHVLDPYGEIGVDEYEALFELRHTNTHTLVNVKFSPRACVALAKDLFELMLGWDDFTFYSGCALSDAGRHARAVDSLKLVRSRSDWKFLSCLGRSLAHVHDKSSVAVLQKAVRSLRKYVKTIPEHKEKEAAWLRIEAARTMCDLAEGFRAAGDGDSESYVNEVLEVCSYSADAYWLAGARLSELGFSPQTSLKCFGKAFELEENVDTAYAVGTTYFKMKEYKDAVDWLKKAQKLDPIDKDVWLALEQAKNHLP